MLLISGTKIHISWIVLAVGGLFLAQCDHHMSLASANAHVGELRWLVGG